MISHGTPVGHGSVVGNHWVCNLFDCLLRFVSHLQITWTCILNVQSTGCTPLVSGPSQRIILVQFSLDLLCSLAAPTCHAFTLHICFAIHADNFFLSFFSISLFLQPLSCRGECTLISGIMQSTWKVQIETHQKLKFFAERPDNIFASHSRI